ncbi:MAG TPA: hypothetical protein VOA41_06210 [Candidatus Dormibacteraeota bacterium]|nr:hypothetical protein [Candidatus Dormibacteraeota bacterium]
MSHEIKQNVTSLDLRFYGDGSVRLVTQLPALAIVGVSSKVTFFGEV